MALGILVFIASYLQSFLEAGGQALRALVDWLQSEGSRGCRIVPQPSLRTEK